MCIPRGAFGTATALDGLIGLPAMDDSAARPCSAPRNISSGDLATILYNSARPVARRRARRASERHVQSREYQVHGRTCSHAACEGRRRDELPGTAGGKILKTPLRGEIVGQTWNAWRRANASIRENIGM
jgi:hypothetical protein